ncbi:D-xylose-proton symporter-like 2 [Dendrobium catenatum]|uniref:D-xylose-proton symporter-like 2 n=1 Tax=Dendrobium catenatum TaxID=906689 RepID=UPI00109F2F41|nr:D-xylose-proton symporter-like 2 [Dendrobium catenatum]
MTSRISDPEQPQISFFSRLSKQHHTEIDKDDTREPLIDGDSSNQSFSLSAAILPFFFPALGGLLYGYDIGATSGATISLEVCQ